MKYIMILFLAMNTYSQAGTTKNPLCAQVDENVTKRIKPQNPPNYFFKTSADGRYIYYISNNKNYQIDTVKGTETLMPGNADPVPSFDGKILTSLNWRSDRPNFSINLMQMRNNDVPRAPGWFFDWSKIYTVPDSTWTYQSVGVLGGDKYRIFAFNDGDGKITIQDFKIKPDGGFKPRWNKIVERKNLEYLRLPMMSKDGQEFIALDVEKNETVIFTIHDDGKIEEKERLKIPTGKGDFSVDRKKIIFHVTEKRSYIQVSDEVNLPAQFNNEAEVRNIFVYNRETKTLTPITQNTYGNSYFPVFLENGTIVYLDQKEKGHVEFVYSKIPEVASRSLEKAISCYEEENFEVVFKKLADEWMRICTDWVGSERGGVKAMILNMPMELCYQLAKNSNDKELKKMCDALAKSEVTKPRIAPAQEEKAQKIFQTRCAMCHQNNIPFNDKAKLKDHADKIIQRIESKNPAERMPIGSKLNKAEIDEIKRYLKEFIN